VNPTVEMTMVAAETGDPTEFEACRRQTEEVDNNETTSIKDLAASGKIGADMGDLHRAELHNFPILI
jgi:hypothetical protein